MDLIIINDVYLNFVIIKFTLSILKLRKMAEKNSIL
jgi:hypothetical protein